MEGYLGQILLWPMSWAPQDWMLCQGQMLQISQNQALYSLIGITYGGDGVHTFALPDLQGRMPIGAGQGSGLPSVQLGQKGGVAATTLTVNNMPSHNHAAAMTLSGLNATTTLNASTQGGGSGTPTAGASLCAANGGPGAANIYVAPAPTTGLVSLGNINTTVSGSGSVTVGNAGGSQPFDNHPPFLGLNFIICMNGMYPQRP